MADTSTRRTERPAAESTDDPRPVPERQAKARSRNQAGAPARVAARAEAREAREVQEAREGQARSGVNGSTAAPAAKQVEGEDWKTNTSSLEPVADERSGSPAGGGRRTAPRPAARAATRARPRGPRRARLRLTRLDPWSVMKTAFLLSIAFAVVTIVAVVIVWTVLGAAGVWESINASVESVIGGEEAQNFDVEDYVGMTRVLGFTMLVAVIDVILITAIATLGAFLYNMSAALLGGIEVTLAEDPR